MHHHFNFFFNHLQLQLMWPKILKWIDNTLCSDLPHFLNNNNKITKTIDIDHHFNWFFFQNILQLKSYKSEQLFFLQSFILYNIMCNNFNSISTMGFETWSFLEKNLLWEMFFSLLLSFGSYERSKRKVVACNNCFIDLRE